MKSIIFNSCREAPCSIISRKYLYSKMVINVSEPTISLARLLASADMRTKGSKIGTNSSLSHYSIILDGVKVNTFIFNLMEIKLLCMALEIGKRRASDLRGIEYKLQRQKDRQDLMIKLGI